MAFSALECGTLVVPLDHSAHLPLESYNDSNTVTLGMARLRAIESTTGSDHDLHRESLIINPGGPGGIASFSLLHQFELESLPSPGDRVPRGMVSHAIRQKYDLIGLDPRGVGLSQAIRCNETLREDRPDILVRTREDYEAVGVWNRQYAQSCLDMSGDLVRYVDSVSVARDFELVRQALGEDKLNFLAISYGTQIAAQYINLYPQHVGRIVLDAVVDHTQDALHSCATDAATFEAALNCYFAWCDTTRSCRDQFLDPDSSGLVDNQRFSTAAIFDSVMDRLSHSPIPAYGCLSSSATCMSSAGLREFITAMQAGLQMQHPLPAFPTSWQNMTANLASAFRGDGTPFSPPRTPRLSDSDGADGIPSSDPAFSAAGAAAIFCLDTARLQSYEAYERQRIGLEALYPHTRGNSNAQTAALNCVDWPIEPANPPRPLNMTQTSQSGEVLILQSTVDPSTSIEWALSLKQQLPRSRMVIRQGVGHTNYILGGEASHIADGYFINGTLPQENTIVRT